MVQSGSSSLDCNSCLLNDRRLLLALLVSVCLNNHKSYILKQRPYHSGRRKKKRKESRWERKHNGMVMVCMCVCLHMCMHVYVLVWEHACLCMCTCMHVHVCVQGQSCSSGVLHLLSEQVFIGWELTQVARLVENQDLSPPPSSPSVGLQVCAPRFLCGFWDSELRSSHLKGKPLTYQANSPAMGDCLSWKEGHTQSPGESLGR